jgi:hypothetical protein
LGPGPTTPQRSSSPSRTSDLRSSRSTVTPQPQALTSLLHPPMRCVVTGHACAVPSTLEEPRARRISFLKAPHGPSLPLAPPPPQRALRLPSTPGRSTPRRRAPAGTVRQGGARGKSRCHTTTQHCPHRCPHPPPLRPSQRGTPLQGDPRAITGDDILATPRARRSSYCTASLRCLFPSSPRPRRGVSPIEQCDPPGPAAVSP